VIGIGTYEHIPLWNVPITAQDAEEVAKVLGDPQLCCYPPSQVQVLSGKKTTRENILAALDGLARTVGKEQTLLIFYAGHGAYSEDGVYHLSTNDTKLDGNNKIVFGTAIAHAELIDRLRKINAERVMLIFNACHAGELSPEALGDTALGDIGQPVPDSAANALLATGSGRVVITACRENQLSYTGTGKLTRFTTALTEGLRGRGDVIGRKGYISAYDLYLHTYYAVSDQAKKRGKEQEPEFTVQKGVGPFAVALYRGAATLGSFDTDETLPTEGAFREVSEARSQAALNIIMSQIAGRDIVKGNQVTAGRDAAGRDLYNVRGDLVQGDQIDARGSQGFINKSSGQVTQVFGSQRNVTTGGGDYAEGDIDKRSGTFVSGDQIAGNISGSNINIRSTLSNVSQLIGSADSSSRPRKQFQSLLEQLDQRLRQAPTEHTRNAEIIAKRIEALCEVVSASPFDVEDFEYYAERLRRAADALSAVLSDIPTLISQLITVARKLAS
jgi:hypothetical protein